MSVMVTIDGKVWRPTNDGTERYDAAHAAAGAILAGAEKVVIYVDAEEYDE